MSEFAESLRNHLAFIARSCELYDQGHLEEALRISVSLRVIFHDTPRSTSLLQHLDRKSVKLISTFVSQKSLAHGYPNMEWHSVIPVMLTSRGVEAPTTSWETRSILSASDWWNEQIWLEGGFALSRKDIVLSAANQDGGAHLDAKPSQRTKKIKVGPEAKVMINGVPLQDGIQNHHYPLIRQLAYEVLESKELYEVAHGT